MVQKMTRRFKLVPFVLFILSGACALIYEVTWARYLGLFLGHTTLAHMCVLAAFMGGLALGSVYIGRITGALRRPLALYGVLEVGIGIYAIAYPVIINPIQAFTLSAASGMQIGTPAWLGLKLVVSAAVLLLPTFLMGGTFPALMRHFQPESPSGEDKSEWLYLLNCAGAVIGALLAGFTLIPQMGLQFTLIGVGAVNAAVGLFALMVAYLEPPMSPAKSEAARDVARTTRHPAAVPVYIAITASGLAAMIYELVWIRIFAVTLGSSTYSFTLMLSAFITGLALGSLTVGIVPWMRRNPLLAFSLAEIAIGLVVLVTLPTYERLPYVFWKWSSLLSRTVGAFNLLNLLKYALCFLVMAVPTFFSGMTLPLAIKAVARRDEHIGRDSGFIYGANTAGTLVGALLTGLVLIRLLGLRHTLELALIVNVLAGVLLLWFTNLRYRRLSAGACCVAALGLMLTMPQWHPKAFVCGTFRATGLAPDSWAGYTRLYSKVKVLFYHEDDDGTVAVVETGGTRGRALFINGKADSSSYSDQCNMVLASQLPMFFNLNARDVLVIGLGAGLSANSALTHPDARVDCIEISPAVGKALKHFDEANDRVRDNPRFNLIYEDGRSYVAATPKKYDVVISEPTNPWIAGVGNLFTREYYQSVDRVLNPGGVMAQWVQTYDMSDDLAKMIVRTVRAVFPYAYIFEAQTSDYIVVASREPLNPDYAQMDKRMSVPAVSRDLNRVSIDSLAALLGRQVLTAPASAVLVGAEGPINSDEFPLLEYGAPEAQFLGKGCAVFDIADQRLTRGTGLFVSNYLGGKPPDKKTAKSLMRAYFDERNRHAALEYAILRYYVSKWPDDRQALGLYAQFAQDVDSAVAARTAKKLMPAIHTAKSLATLADILGSDRMQSHSVFTPQDFRDVLSALDKALKLDPANRQLQTKRKRFQTVSE